MANEESVSKEYSPLKVAIMYFVYSVSIIALLLLFTEILMDATVLHNTMLLLVMVICAFVPFTIIIIRSEGPSSIVCKVSLGVTLVLAIIDLYFRAKVSRFYVEDGYKLTTEDLQTIASATSPNGVVILLNNQGGFSSAKKSLILDPDAEDVQKELEELLAKPEQIGELNIEGKEPYTKEQLETVSSWSRPFPRIIYSFKTDEKPQNLPNFTVLKAKPDVSTPPVPPPKQPNNPGR